MVAAIHDFATCRSCHAHLQCERVAGKTAVTSAFATSPLKLLTPRSRGESVWAYLSSFGGGMVAGDETRLDLALGPITRCFVGTQASTKIYRNPARRPCSHRVHAEVAKDSLLVLAPDPVQSFADSSFSQRQKILLHPTAGLVLLDWCCSGRVARGERWAFNSYASRIEIFQTLEASKSREPPTNPRFLAVSSSILCCSNPPTARSARRCVLAASTASRCSCFSARRWPPPRRRCWP